MPDVPQQLDRFEIVRLLGKGGMGSVYLARDQRLGRQVAVKVLHAEDLESEDRRARFLREARAVASVRHPNVATIYEVDETPDGSPFLVMEYCEGETLSQRMRRRPLDGAEFLSIARQLAAGVAAAHENGVLHRDIKAANVILEPTGAVKILDFGLAKLIPREQSITVVMEKGGGSSFESTSGQFLGTLHYLSPEQASGEGADERSDLFALGVLYYQMATGQFPFNADAPLMVLQKIRTAEPEPFVPLDAHFPMQAARIIGKLLQKNPADRYQSARDLLIDLEAVDTPTLRVSSLNTRTSLGRTRPRPHWLRLAVIAVALAIVVTTIFLVRSTRPKAQPQAGNTIPAEATPIRSMAVLPLENIANNTGDDFLSVGLADALVTKLQQIPSLQVRPTSAVLEFRKSKIDPKLASQRLQVDGVLEGHFLAAGDLVRVNLQLTDSRTGYSIWAEQIDGKRDDLLKLIDDVSAKTLDGLNEKLGVKQLTTSSAPRSKNKEAYEAYLKSRALKFSLVPDEYRQQIALLKQAVKLDPDFAAAYADLAIAYSLGQARSLTNEPDAAQKAEAYARQAVRLDPNLAQAHLALGRAFVRFPDRFREAARENLAAVRLNPNDPQSLQNVASYFNSLGEQQRTQCIDQRMVSLDPLSNDARTRGYRAVNAVDADGAIRDAEYALASKDTELAGHDIRANGLILQGNLDAALIEARKATALVPSHYIGKSLFAEIAAAHGDAATAHQYLASFEADANRNHWAALRQALCYAKLGEREKALAWLQKSSDGGNHSWYFWIKHPWLQPLQGDPAFQQMITKIKSDLDDVHDDFVGVYQLLCSR